MKKLLLIVALVTSSFFGFSQELENSLLWEISGNGLEKPSYLFGTIHITCDASLSDKVKDALDKTSQLALEVDMDDPQLQLTMMQNMRMKEGKTIKNFISDEEFALVDSLFVKHVGMSIGMMQNVRPFILSAMLIPKMIDCPMESVETELMEVAKAQKEEIVGLETADSQIQIFDDIPYKDQLQELVKSAKDNLANDKENIQKMLKIYQEENITELFRFIRKDQDALISQHMDKMLDARNKNWIPEIGKYAKEQPTFFGVGAGHLAGENGVINLLRKAGYTVKAIKN